MIANGKIVRTNWNVLGKIVGKTFGGMYVISLERGTMIILALTEFTLA